MSNHDQFKNMIFNMTSDIIWKNKTVAIEGESNVDSYQAELFVTANRGLLNFNIIRSFPREVLRGIGVLESDIERYATDKNVIPMELRPLLVAEYTNALSTINPSTNRNEYKQVIGSFENWISIYEELNPYYRMLNGLPDVNDFNYVYVTNVPGIPNNVPVHLLPYSDRLILEQDGVIDTLIAQNPTKKYLKHLGIKQISLYAARSAERFSILYIAPSGSTSDIDMDFKDAYNANSQLITYVYFTQAYTKNNPLYENFLALCILFMTIHSMQSKYLLLDISRDFYDTDSLQYIYSSYGVPFYTEIPLQYHQRLIKNINKLITYKGSTTVFFDLFSLFDMGNVDIYSYYFTKSNKFDEYGNLIYEPQLDEDGNIILDETGRPLLTPESYDLGFVKVLLGEDPSLAMVEEKNQVPLEDIVNADPYWVQDENVQKVLNNSYYNYNESKYIGIQTMTDLLAMSYENAYIYKLILDNKDTTDNLVIDTNTGIKASLFDLFIYLSALYAKKVTVEEQISSKLPITAKLLGYNFKETLANVRNNLLDSSILTPDLEQLFSSLNISDINSVNRVFENIVEIKDLLISGMHDSKTLEEYRSYRYLYDTMLTSELVEEVYQLPDGTVANTFSELLASTSPELFSRLTTIPVEGVVSEMDDVILILQSEIESINSLSSLTGYGSSKTIDSLYKMLTFFKSAKTQLVGYDIVFQITGRGMNFFKFLDRVYLYTNDFSYRDYQGLILYDLITRGKELVTEKLGVQQILIETISTGKSYMKFIEYMYMIDKDLMDIYELTKSLKDNMLLTDNLVYMIERCLEIIKDHQHLYDEALMFDEVISMIEESFELSDKVNKIDDTTKTSDSNPSYDGINIVYSDTSMKIESAVMYDVLFEKQDDKLTKI